MEDDGEEGEIGRGFLVGRGSNTRPLAGLPLSRLGLRVLFSRLLQCSNGGSGDHSVSHTSDLCKRARDGGDWSLPREELPCPLALRRKSKGFWLEAYLFQFGMNEK